MQGAAATTVLQVWRTWTTGKRRRSKCCVYECACTHTQARVITITVSRIVQIIKILTKYCFSSTFYVAHILGVRLVFLLLTVLTIFDLIQTNFDGQQIFFLFEMELKAVKRHVAHNFPTGCSTERPNFSFPSSLLSHWYVRQDLLRHANISDV
jgi:hypothetical protein